MIGSVRGDVLERTLAGEVLVEAAGIGYRVLVPVSAVPALEPGSHVFLFTHQHVQQFGRCCGIGIDALLCP